MRKWPVVLQKKTPVGLFSAVKVFTCPKSLIQIVPHPNAVVVVYSECDLIQIQVRTDGGLQGI